jgi:hypothetical protein
MHMAGGGCTGGGGGMHVHPVPPPWVRPWYPYLGSTTLVRTTEFSRVITDDIVKESDRKELRPEKFRASNVYYFRKSYKMCTLES